MNPRTDKPVGYAFVDVSTPNEAQRALIELNSKSILDRKVSVQLARIEGQGQVQQQGATPTPSRRNRTASLTSGPSLLRPPIAQSAQQIQQRIVAGTRRAAGHVVTAELADPSSFLLACDNFRKTATESTGNNAAGRLNATTVPTQPTAATSVQEASDPRDLQKARDNVLKTAMDLAGNNAAGRLNATTVPTPPATATSVQEASISTSVQSRRPSWASVTSTAASRSRPVRAVLELANPNDWLRKRDQVLGRGSTANTKLDVSQNQDKLASTTPPAIVTTPAGLAAVSHATAVVAQTPASLFAADRAIKPGSTSQPSATATVPPPPVPSVTALSTSIPEETPEATRADSVLGNHEPVSFTSHHSDCALRCSSAFHGSLVKLCSATTPYGCNVRPPRHLYSDKYR